MSPSQAAEPAGRQLGSSGSPAEMSRWPGVPPARYQWGVDSDSGLVAEASRLGVPGLYVDPSQGLPAPAPLSSFDYGCRPEGRRAAREPPPLQDSEHPASVHLPRLAPGPQGAAAAVSAASRVWPGSAAAVAAAAAAAADAAAQIAAEAEGRR